MKKDVKYRLKVNASQEGSNIEFSGDDKMFALIYHLPLIDRMKVMIEEGDYDSCLELVSGLMASVETIKEKIITVMSAKTIELGPIEGIKFIKKFIEKQGDQGASLGKDIDALSDLWSRLGE